MHRNTLTNLFLEVANRIRLNRGTFPFMYLGCPIFHTMKKMVYYNELIKKIKDILQSWKGELLSFRGKAILINNLLQSMPLYLFSAMAPTKYTINEIHRVFARFFWSNKEEGRSRHWFAWLKLCIPIEEEGLEFRSHFDVSKALFTKLWWKFRNTSSLWSTSIWNKYYNKKIPTLI